MEFDRCRLPLAVFILIFAIFVLPSHAQTGSVTGTVIGLDGNLLEGATVRFLRVGSEEPVDILSVDDGTFAHDALRVGTYTVTLLVNGRIMFTLDDIAVRTGNLAVNLDMPTMLNSEEAREALSERARNDAAADAFTLGREALTAGSFDEAIVALTEAAENDATQPIIFANLAEALVGARRFDEAVESYEKAIVLEPTEPAYYNNLSLALGNAGRVDEAIEAIEKTAELDPDLAGDGYYNLGAVLTNQGRPAEAAAAFQRATEVDPNRAEAYYQLGISYFASAETIPDAVPAFERYLELAPDSPNAEAARALLAAAQGAQ